MKLGGPCSSAARRIEELQDSLQKKDADLRAMEERYRRYVDKARTVRMLGVPLSCLDPSPYASHQLPLLPVCVSLPSAFTHVTPDHIIP